GRRLLGRRGNGKRRALAEGTGEPEAAQAVRAGEEVPFQTPSLGRRAGLLQVVLYQLVFDHAERLERVGIGDQQLLELWPQFLFQAAESVSPQGSLDVWCQAHVLAPSALIASHIPPLPGPSAPVMH